jgi:DNA-binding MarR family transcriptional regulator
MTRETEAARVDELIAAYRESTSQDAAFDALAAERLGIGLTDLKCLALVESSGGLTAGRLADLSGLTTGAVTGVLDRLERAGLVRRVRDDGDRRKVNVAVTQEHYERSEPIWRPLYEDWHALLASRFTTHELAVITSFLTATTELGRRHASRLRGGEGSANS